MYDLSDVLHYDLEKGNLPVIVLTFVGCLTVLRLNV